MGFSIGGMLAPLMPLVTQTSMATPTPAATPTPTASIPPPTPASPAIVYEPSAPPQGDDSPSTYAPPPPEAAPVFARERANDGQAVSSLSTVVASSTVRTQSAGDPQSIDARDIVEVPMTPPGQAVIAVRGAQMAAPIATLLPGLALPDAASAAPLDAQARSQAMAQATYSLMADAAAQGPSEPDPIKFA